MRRWQNICRPEIEHYPWPNGIATAADTRPKIRAQWHDYPISAMLSRLPGYFRLRLENMGRTHEIILVTRVRKDLDFLFYDRCRLRVHSTQEVVKQTFIAASLAAADVPRASYDMAGARYAQCRRSEAPSPVGNCHVQ
jgi:hypothetical protein